MATINNPIIRCLQYELWTVCIQVWRKWRGLSCIFKLIVIIIPPPKKNSALWRKLVAVLQINNTWNVYQTIFFTIMGSESCKKNEGYFTYKGQRPSNPTVTRRENRPPSSPQSQCATGGNVEGILRHHTNSCSCMLQGEAKTKNKLTAHLFVQSGGNDHVYPSIVIRT